MGLQGEKKLEDILTGALIGLARTTYSHLKTENTDRVVTCALSVLVRVDADEKELEKQLEQVRAEKLAVAPGCATCVAKCGNTDDYDMDRFWNGPVQVRSLKLLKMEMKKTAVSRISWLLFTKDFLSWQRTGNRRKYSRL